MAAVMFLRKAMRYYRLWIYTCNAVLLVSVFVFMGVAAGVVSHPYFSLVPAPPAYHPTLLYGYVALLLQAGILQALGCMGALRLSQKLLNIYWLLLLFLLLGDVVVGLVWLYRFSHLTDGLRPYARATLHNHYGRDQDITDAWDTLQKTSECCGVVTPKDYNATWWDIHEQNLHSMYILKLPASCCRPYHNNEGGGGRKGSPDTRRMTSYQADQQARHVPPYPHDGSGGGRPINSVGGVRSINASVSLVRYSVSSGTGRGWHERNLTCSGAGISSSGDPSSGYDFYKNGCHPDLEKWLLSSTETLMILGFCVIAFIKLCFVGILRFEIQEMIQKIKVLQGETQCTPNPELAAALGLVSPDKAAECGLLSTGGGDGEGGGGTGGGGDEGGGGDNRGDQDSPAATPLTQPRLNHLSGHTDGAESDTNSHCALITDTPIRRPQPDKRRPNGNNNDVTELRELRHIRQTQI